MVVDSLKNTDMYERIHPLFKQVFDYLRSTNFLDAEVGKIELQGDDLFVIVSDSNLKSREAAKLEVHNRYIDIQMPISMPETFGWKSRQALTLAQAPYNETKDIQFFDDQAVTFLTLSPNTDFVIFYPEDAHAPCIGEGRVRKVVVKIKI